MSYLLWRFLPGNIWHVLHDDLLGLFATMKMTSTEPGATVLDSPQPFRLDSRYLSDLSFYFLVPSWP